MSNGTAAAVRGAYVCRGVVEAGRQPVLLYSDRPCCAGSGPRESPQARAARPGRAHVRPSARRAQNARGRRRRDGKRPPLFGPARGTAARSPYTGTVVAVLCVFLPSFLPRRDPPAAAGRAGSQGQYYTSAWYPRAKNSDPRSNPRNSEAHGPELTWTAEEMGPCRPEASRRWCAGGARSSNAAGRPARGVRSGC